MSRKPVAWDCTAYDGGRYLIRAVEGAKPLGWPSCEPLYAACDVTPVERKEEPLEHVEKVSTEAAMSQWERSLKRPDLSEKDRVRGAIEAYKRQAFAFAISPTPPAAAVRVDAEALERLTRFSRGRPKVYEGQPFDCDKLIKADVRHVLSALSASPSPVDSRDAGEVSTGALNDMLLARAPDCRWTIASILKERGLNYRQRLDYMRAALSAALAAKEQQADTGIMMSPTEMILTQDENSLIGLVMRLTGGSANPNVVKGQIERIRKEKACETTSSPS